MTHSVKGRPGSSVFENRSAEVIMRSPGSCNVNVTSDRVASNACMLLIYTFWSTIFPAACSGKNCEIHIFVAAVVAVIYCSLPLEL